MDSLQRASIPDLPLGGHFLLEPKPIPSGYSGQAKKKKLTPQVPIQVAAQGQVRAPGTLWSGENELMACCQVHDQVP